MNILLLGIGNILFGDEGIGPHLVNLIDNKYKFASPEHTLDIIDGGTLAQRLIPIITEYDKVILVDCVNVDEGKVGDVYTFSFDDVPNYITWNGSAHEVEMLQTLQMIEMIGDLPPVQIVGVIPYVIGENSTFSMTPEVIEASKLMERVILDQLSKIGFDYEQKKDIEITDIVEHTYLKGTQYDTTV